MWVMWCVESKYKGGLIEFKVFESESAAKGYVGSQKLSGIRATYWEL